MKRKELEKLCNEENIHIQRNRIHFLSRFLNLSKDSVIHKDFSI